MDYVGSFINYPGGKTRLLSQLLPLFPTEPIQYFIDLFCGSAVVSLNVPYNIPIIANDSNTTLIRLLSWLGNQSYMEFTHDVYSVITHYGLSDTSRHGYHFYGITSTEGLASINRAAFNKLRQDFNAIDCANDESLLLLYVLIVFGFNNQLRFNQQGFFNNPVGKRDFNKRMQLKLYKFMQESKTRNIHFVNNDFRKISSLRRGGFIYADPPYSLSTAVYNENHGWSKENDLDLFRYLDEVDRSGCFFALSNVTALKGSVNNELLEWSKRYNTHHLAMSYAHSSYNTSHNGDTDEVLITNY